jgi:hypothetical protein
MDQVKIARFLSELFYRVPEALGPTLSEAGQSPTIECPVAGRLTDYFSGLGAVFEKERRSRNGRCRACGILPGTGCGEGDAVED